ncbi:glycosyltransferase family 2 protein [Ketobacter sp.]|uniref:glycosyltransferase family 2 protein n=1 Tax=Ketobacter sp. TaxID=2083498 RepID=UPI000F2D22CA|nr:glycosyltransferase [Ketobacter sp.]RLU01364.1 MAG: glycosyltransferase [Ketobacter sp.]
MSDINICVCTFQRVALLAQCLNSLTEMRLPENTTVTVTVVDNDVNGSAKSTVERLFSKFPLALHYKIEPKRGIPCARNSAIVETLRMGSDYLIFIDDDEWVERDWLVSLLDYSRSLGGGVVVHGRVISELPVGLPPEISGLFGKKARPTGLKLSACATDNVLIPAIVYRDLGLKFDETYPLAGGTDTKYFVEAVSRGIEIYQCAEAVVHEHIPQSRTSLRWLAKRKYRAGITDAWRKKKMGANNLRILLSSLLKIILALLKLVVCAILGRKLNRNQAWLKLSKSVGQIAGLFGRSIDSYRTVDS